MSHCVEIMDVITVTSQEQNGKWRENTNSGAKERVTNQPMDKKIGVGGRGDKEQGRMPARRTKGGG